MGNHFREPDTFVQFSPETRKRIEKAIEGLVALLDQCDGDPDREDDGNGEPWLGSTICEDKGYIRPNGDDRELDNENDEETGDDEPWLSAAAVGWGSHMGGLDYEEDFIPA